MAVPAKVTVASSEAKQQSNIKLEEPWAPRDSFQALPMLALLLRTLPLQALPLLALLLRACLGR